MVLMLKLFHLLKAKVYTLPFENKCVPYFLSVQCKFQNNIIIINMKNNDFLQSIDFDVAITLWEQKINELLTTGKTKEYNATLKICKIS